MNKRALFVTFVPIPALIYIAYTSAPVAWRPIHCVGAGLLIVGTTFITIARLQLGNSFSVAPRATALVTTGLYARIRNPVYVFGMVLLAGLILYLDRPLLVWVFIPIAAVQVVRARREAKVLEGHFGDEYRAYRARTWF